MTRYPFTRLFAAIGLFSSVVTFAATVAFICTAEWSENWVVIFPAFCVALFCCLFTATYYLYLQLYTTERPKWTKSSLKLLTGMQFVSFGLIIYRYDHRTYSKRGKYSIILYVTNAIVLLMQLGQILLFVYILVTFKKQNNLHSKRTASKERNIEVTEEEQETFL